MTAASRRLLVVAGGTRSTASTRHRLWNYRPYLDRDGVALEWVEYGGGRIVSAHAAGRARGRFALELARRLGGREVVLVQKVLPHIGLVRWWRHLGCRVVYDFDDALFERFQWGEGTDRAERRRRRFDAMLETASHVIAGSPPLAEYARTRTGAVTVLYPSLQRERFAALAPRADDPPVIGWVGNDQSQVYLRALEPALAAALASHPTARLRICSSRLPELPSLPPERVDFVPWSEQGELEAVASFHLAVSPLADDPWSRSRGGRVSVLLSLAAGVPVIASPGGGLEELAGDTGTAERGVVFAGSPEEWRGHLERLLANPEERHRRSVAARELIDRRIWADVQYPDFVRAVFGN